MSIVAPDGDSDYRFNTMSLFKYDFQVEKESSGVKYSVCIHRILNTSGKICDFQKQLSELNSQVHGIHSMILSNNAACHFSHHQTEQSAVTSHRITLPPYVHTYTYSISDNVRNNSSQILLRQLNSKSII